MESFSFDREKYVNLSKSQGLSKALTALHDDLAVWEYDAFEGKKGYQPSYWRALEAVRQFSRELWDISLQITPAYPKR